MAVRMAECPVVLVAFFDKKKNEPRHYLPIRGMLPPFEEVEELQGLPLYKVNGRAVYKWAIDHITCSDTRWVVFGPFVSRGVARTAYDNNLSMLEESEGFHIVNEHCLPYQYGQWNEAEKKIELPAWAWTDG